ncbi:hypothetical protein JI735_34270 (plasmid) [Paenibacillus sonchi]|uniref:Uncharacterized protein n=1 Tax=Paenibacillus sonchi TaxID=373687 RepID=A0A974PJM4_9BACL|nr:hypothetical protein [Paenibacillus sonchi]QQZ64507.1 hypothetical protein JI735_34270 [Paenibacillus sonchi]
MVIIHSVQVGRTITRKQSCPKSIAVELKVLDHFTVFFAGIGAFQFGTKPFVFENILKSAVSAYSKYVRDLEEPQPMLHLRGAEAIQPFKQL